MLYRHAFTPAYAFQSGGYAVVHEASGSCAYGGGLHLHCSASGILLMTVLACRPQPSQLRLPHLLHLTS